MNDPLRVHPDVGILETRDPRATPTAVRKQCERVASELLEDRIVVAA